jgi:hypothetical protein
MASNFYRAKDAPGYILGHALELGFLSVGVLATLTLITGYVISNKKRARKLEQGAVANYTSEELSALGDKAITFRYML